ncbi:hypothetical protein DPMN_194576 [Dreissena polymorpha]|uniref:Uncharacterized protein n=1 Tax=Dreissena polymorpha TaxID=45954 RepID=A0A9D3Y572_DREPO|nr:hypothetical protein DPMN_194576 [Dreissena polymorpha]
MERDRALVVNRWTSSLLYLPLEWRETGRGGKQVDQQLAVPTLRMERDRARVVNRWTSSLLYLP